MPATTDELRKHLILTLNAISPSLTDDQQLAWIRVATIDLAHLPVIFLAEACKHARATCSFPGQIIPAILSHVEPAMPAIERAAREWREARQLEDRRGNVASIGNIAKQLTHNRSDDHDQ